MGHDASRRWPAAWAPGSGVSRAAWRDGTSWRTGTDSPRGTITTGSTDAGAAPRASSGRPFGVRLAILFLTVFVDLVGFGIVLPLLPFYADRFGASGLQIGILVLSYSAAQLVFAPIWGRLSDRFGRRPILLVGLVGSAISYVIFAFAGSITALLISRIMAGTGGANIPVAQAYIADITPPEKRAGNMGLIGAAFGLGFIFGPAIGGLLAPIDPAAPGLAAAALCLVNAGLAFFLLPESLSPEERARKSEGALLPSREGPSRLEEAAIVLKNPAFLQVLVLSFLFTAAFSAMHPVFPLFADERFGLGERGVGWLFAFLGTISALMQGIIVRILAPRVGEIGLVRLSALPFVAGLVLIAVAPTLPILLVALALLAVGFGGTLPSLVSLLSRAAPDELQGGSLGVGQSVGALARIVGPLMGGIMWDLFGGPGPFLSAALVAMAAAIWGFRLRVTRTPAGVGTPA
ncbi:MAG: MFS transporter [Gemmatimonadales bacterium]|nr:MAG: MFS transporter [Gemmatimonadales bacterium]